MVSLKSTLHFINGFHHRISLDGVTDWQGNWFLRANFYYTQTAMFKDQLEYEVRENVE